jgi:hypothetical protein
MATETTLYYSQIVGTGSSDEWFAAHPEFNRDITAIRDVRLESDQFCHVTGVQRIIAQNRLYAKHIVFIASDLELAKQTVEYTAKHVPSYTTVTIKQV